MCLLGKDLVRRMKKVTVEWYWRSQRQQIDSAGAGFQPLHFLIENAEGVSRIYQSDSIAGLRRLGALSVIPNPIRERRSEIQIVGEEQERHVLDSAMIV